MSPVPMTKRVPEVGRETCVNGEHTPFRQLGLFDLPTDAEGMWQKLREYLADAVAQIGHKEVAYALDVSASQLSNALAERDRHSIPMRWLPFLIRMARTDDLLAYIAALGGREITAPAVLTPEEELTRMKQALLKNFGPAGADLIRKDVYGSGR